MQFLSGTFSRAQLQAIPEERRLQAIVAYIDHNVHAHVVSAAAVGKTSYLHPFPMPKNSFTTNPSHYVPTTEDIIEGLKVKFPDCSVSFVEEWVDQQRADRTQLPTRVLKSGIKIDWS